jgi:hypothetical protein
MKLSWRLMQQHPRQRTRRVFAVLILLAVLSIATLAVGVRQIEPRLHHWVTSRLAHALESDVALEAITLNWMPLRLEARNLTVRHHGRTDVPPLLVVASFTADLRPTDLWSSTIERVRVDGLEINIPPKDPDTGKRRLPRARDDGDAGDDEDAGFVLRHLTATNTRLAVIPRDADKNPRVWDIFELDMRNLRAGEPATFTAALINPIPYGTIESTGSFGPWQSADPGASPLGGDYTFEADLGTIEGLGGDLSAVGEMRGTLERIATTGQTWTDAFRLTELEGDSLPLATSYEAVVDGTKGDVELNKVDVQLGGSTFLATGVVEGTKGVKGKRVVLNVRSGNADLGELLRFVSRATQPPAYGRLRIDTAFDLPQGKEPVLTRIELDGAVHADRIRFTNEAVQEKIDDLSRRGQGRPEDAAIEEVASQLSTTFSLRDGVMTYRGLAFAVAGARVRMDGIHSLRTKAVKLRGEVRLHATLSQTQTGFKSWLLKPFDPLFRKKGAGTRLVIRVEGTQDQPSVGLELGKTLRGQ